MAKRTEVHEFYDRELEKYGWLDRPLPIPKDCTTSYYFYHIQLKNGKRDQLAGFLRENGIYTTYRYYPMHRVAGYGITGEFPNADFATDNTLCLPIHQGLTADDLVQVVETIEKFDKKYC